MNTLRLKNIVIVILALLNVCLLTMLLTRRGQERAARERTTEELVQLYAASGVTLPPSLVPERAVPFASADPVRSLESEAAFAEAVLGPCTAEEVGGGIYRYVAQTGQCLLRSSGTVEAALDRAVDDPEAFCSSLFSSCGYAALSTDLSDGGGTVVAVRTLPGGAVVFNAELVLTFAQYRLVSVTGSFVPPVEPNERGEGIDGVTALVYYLDHSNASGEVCTAISDVRAGYLLQSTASVSQRLAPAWSITTDVSRYYVNSQTGEITRET